MADDEPDQPEDQPEDASDESSDDERPDDPAAQQPGVLEGVDLGDALQAIEAFLLGEAPSLTRLQVSEQAGMEQGDAEQLWRLMGFPHAADRDRVFAQADVEALALARDLVGLGILGADDTSALVRTWGRSFARLAEWQTSLLARTAANVPGDDPTEQLTTLASEVLPRVEKLQSYVWRRHLLSASGRLIGTSSDGDRRSLAVCFVDIVGFTSRSKTLSEGELVDWLENFEDACTQLAIERGGRVIKTIGDEVLLVTDRVRAAAELALDLVARGEDDDDPFPQVRAGIAHGEVISRLGDVFGPVVNIASRLTDVARPGTVLLDLHAYESLSGQADDPDADPHDHPDYRFRRVRRTPVKGYSKLQPFVVRRR